MVDKRVSKKEEEKNVIIIVTLTDRICMRVDPNLARSAVVSRSISTTPTDDDSNDAYFGYCFFSVMLQNFVKIT